MFRQLFRMIYGWVWWNFFCIWNRIRYSTVVIVITGNNEELDKYALLYLDEFMRRKSATRALVICTENIKRSFLNQENIRKIIEKQKASIVILNEKKMELLYDFYSFYKCFDNLVFTYTSKPKENMLGRVLNETDVNEEDAVCLALYHLRCIPQRSEEGEELKCMLKS